MEEDNRSEAILVLKCLKRDEVAFRELVDRWEPRLYYYLRRIVENESAVWDTLQDTWLAVFQNIHKLEDPQKFAAWLYRIAHHKAVSLLRKENKSMQLTNEQMSDYCESDFVVSYDLEHTETVHQLLTKLKLEHREALTLHFLGGFSIKEMAQITGVPEGTIKSRLFYAKNKLYEALKGTQDV